MRQRCASTSEAAGPCRLHRELLLQQRRDRCVEQRRILRAINEAGEIAIVPVRPARGFVRQRRLAGKIADDRAGHIENDVIGTPGQPYQRIMLTARHDESFSAPDVAVKAHDAWRRVIWNNIAPEFRPEPDDEVHSSRGGARFTDRSDRSGKLLAFLRVQKIKLQIRMRGGSKRKYSRLGRVHGATISGA